MTINSIIYIVPADHQMHGTRGLIPWKYAEECLNCYQDKRNLQHGEDGKWKPETALHERHGGTSAPAPTTSCVALIPPAG